MPRRFKRRRRLNRNRRRRPRRRRRRSLVLDPERKFNEVANATLLVNQAGVVTSLNSGIAQGLGNQDRIGIQHINLSSAFSMVVDINGGIAPVTLKAWLIWDADPRGVLMTLGNLLAIPTQPLTSQRNLSHTLRLKVLWTRTFQIDVFNTQRRMLKFRRMRKKSRWNAAGAGVGNLEHGMLVLLFASNIVAAPFPSIDFSHRLRFVG